MKGVSLFRTDLLHHYLFMSNTHLTLGNVFDACQDIELRFAKIYARLSLLLGEVDDRVARFWETMSAQEWQHYVLVEFGRGLCSTAFDLDTLVDDLPAVSFISQIKDDLLKHEQQAAQMDITLSDGFRMTIEIESSEADELFIYLAKMTEKAIYKNNQTFLLNRLNRIQKEMQNHHQTVIEAAKRLSNDPDIVRRAVSLSHK